MTLNSLKSGSIVVIGGGFGGLTTALSLSRCKGRPPIILIEPRPRFVFLPLLYELLSGELEAWEVAPSYDTLLSERGIVLINQFVDNIDLEREVVITSCGQVIHYGQLVIATGSKPDTFGIEGVQDHSFTFNKYEDVETIKKLINSQNVSKNQNLVIVGAGSTGVELACKISDLIEDPSAITLIEAGERVLPQGKSFNQEQIENALRRKSIQVHLNTRVLKITENDLEIMNLNEPNPQPFLLKHAGVIWTAGVKPSIPDGLPQSILNNGRVLIDSSLKVIGSKNVFCIGDVALNLSNPYSGTAQVAMQQGKHLVKNLMALLKDEPLNSFEFLDRGEMLSMGIDQATITGMGLTIAGSIAFKRLD